MHRHLSNDVFEPERARPSGILVRNGHEYVLHHALAKNVNEGLLRRKFGLILPTHPMSQRQSRIHGLAPSTGFLDLG
ncbi:hypothetical protein GJ744_005429 [Endocarpon pusillum]|uniref:Uncharacterized protein n=1 Tax=Endocarpon pusillum TaxID=364733 RepID=A0A8H7A5N9_9EURO|nr:hypothetical protein GJ744_005429 [Endocarpon pusillum]